MNEIKFSHNYPKLHGQSYARLMATRVMDREQLHQDFVEYDTRYGKTDAERYPLPSGPLLILLFWGKYGIPFTTVRRWTAEKERYYRGMVGQEFKLVLVPPSPKSETPANLPYKAD